MMRERARFTLTSVGDRHLYAIGGCGGGSNYENNQQNGNLLNQGYPDNNNDVDLMEIGGQGLVGGISFNEVYESSLDGRSSH